jgi:hypothetical protein
VRWAQPVSGDFADPTKWAGPVPAGTQYDPLFDVTDGGAPYYVLSNTPVQTGHLTIAAPDAHLVVRNMTAVRGVDVAAGRLLLDAFGRLEAPFVNVANGGSFYADSNYDTRIHVATLRGTATVRAPLLVERDLALDQGQLLVQRHGVTFLNGSRLSGSGTVFFAESEGYLRSASAAAPLVIESGVTLAGTHGGRLDNVVNHGTFRSDAANPGSLIFTGTNHGRLDVGPGGGVIRFTGTNESAGVISIQGAANVFARPGLSLYGATNRGTISVVNGGLSLHDGLTNTGTLRLVDTDLGLYGNFTTGALGQVERVGGRTIVAGTLDNRGATIDLDTFGPVDFVTGSTLHGGRVAGSAAGASRLTFSGPNFVTLQGVTLDVPVNLADSAGPLQVRDGLTVNRDFSINDRRSVLFVNSATLDGTGRVNLAGGSDGGIHQAAGTTVTIAPGMTVRTSGPGANYVGTYYPSDPADHVSLVNRGHIVAGRDSAVTMNGKNWKNEGVVTLEQGAMLNLGGTFNFADVGTVERNGGRVNFAGDIDLTGRTFDLSTSPVGPLDLGSSYIVGGRLVSPGRPVEVRKTNSQRDGLAVNGTVLALNLDLVGSGNLTGAGSDVTLDGATVRLKGSNSRVIGRAVMGNGDVVFDAASVGVPGPLVEAPRVGPGVTIRTGASGGGFFLWNANDTVTNDGRILAETPGRIISSGYTVDNNGTIEARNGGAVSLGGGHNHGTVRASAGGAIFIGARFQPFVNGGTFIVEPTGYLDLGGTLAGAGVELRGTIRPGGTFIGTGTLDLQAALDFEPTTTLAVQVQSAGGADRLDVAGAVVLEGTLRVDSVNGAPVLPGTSFEVLRFNSRDGDFDSIVNNTGFAGLTFVPTYDQNSLTLLTDALDGDANLDGRVDAADLLLVRRNLRRSNRDWLSGDFDGNGRVNLRDMELVRRNFGAELPGLVRMGTGASAVPEPAMPGGLLVLSGALLRRRRR